MSKNNIIISLVGLVILLLVGISSFKVDGRLSSEFCLKKNYDYYQKTFLSEDGRIIDFDKGGITTSEGQSYILLESVIMDDKQTFDLAYAWAKNNLQRPDRLFAWLWGKNGDGNYKIIDDNSASDADVDIAFALLLAYEKWGDSCYLQEALPIISSIWDNEVISVGQHLVLMPGVKQASDKSKIEINPSYFSFYAFRFFQKYDEFHDWNRLIDSSYYYVNQAMSATKSGLPPDWCLIKDGQVVLENSPRSNFSYDAIRVFLRAYLDYLRSGDKRSLKILEASKFFVVRWENTQKFYTNYTAEGKLADNVEFLGSVAILVPIINRYNQDVAEEIYKKKVKPYSENEAFWLASQDYYAKNLMWFGCYLSHQEGVEYKKMGQFAKQFRAKNGK